MKRKLFAILFVTLLVVASLASCKIKGKDNQDSAGDSAPAEKGVIFSPDIEVRLIKSKDNTKLSLDELFDAYSNCTGSFAPIRDDGEAAIKNEIVIGDTNRPISAKAKEALENGLVKVRRDWEDRGLETDFLIGYAVYSDGESVAVVWSDDAASPYAFEYFIVNYLNNRVLMLEDGYVNVRGLDLIEALREEEEEDDARVYADIAAEYGWDVANALKAHLGMFDERYYYWLADLYNPGEYDENGNPKGGGFYYSNSGRDNEGYLIDLESTMQALSWITGSSGLFSGQAQARETLPASMLDELAAFALSCQSSTDGYFYHPQWGTSVGTSRIGRDLSWATQILSYCQVKPYWNTPNNTKGFYGEPSGDDSVKSLTVKEYRELLANAPSAALSEPLSGSAVSAVSKVLATAGTRKWNGSSWLATMDAWEAYLQSYDANIHKQSYSIGNNFSAQSGQINTRDKLAIENGEYPDVRDVNGNSGADGIADGGYVETWRKYFDGWQFENGLWEECSLEEGTVYYSAINGLMKISSCYDSLKLPFPRATEAFKCAVFMCTYLGDGTVTGKDSEDWKDSKGKAPTNSVDVYNPWVAMSHILAIVGRSDKALQAELRQITKDNALEMIKVTTKKIGKFSKNDGSFGYSWTYSPANSQGAPVAVPNTVEGDINGGNIAFTGTFGTMRGVLGITGELKPFNYSDGLLFAKRISELSPILKGGAGSESDSAETGIRDFNGDVAGSKEADGVTTSFNAGSVEIVAHEDNKKDNFLRFNCVSSDKGGNTVTFPAKQEKSSSGSVFEFKLRYTSIPKDVGTAFQITMGSYMWTMGIYADGTFKIGDSSSTGSPNISKFYSTKFTANEWHTIRIEFYVLDAAERETVAQIYVDGQLLFVSDNYVGKEKDSAPSTTFKNVKFFSLKANNCIIDIDDVYAAQITTPFVDKPIYVPGLVKDFDNVTAGGDTLPDGVTTTGGAVVSSPTEENPANNTFVLDASGDTVKITAADSYASPNCYSLSTKMKIDYSGTGVIANLCLTGSDTSKIIAAYKIEVYEKDGVKLAKLVEYDREGKPGNSFEGIPVGEFFTLTVEFYPYFYKMGECAIVYLNGAELGRGETYYHIGTIATDYKAFTLTMTADATVSLDDVSPDRVSKAFTAADGSQVEDPEIKLPLAITAKDESISVNASKDSTSPNCYIVTTKMKIEASTAGAIANLFIAGNDATKAIAAYRVETYYDGSTLCAKLVEFDKDGKTGKTISGLPVGTDFTLTIEFYPYFYDSDNCTIVYVDGKEVGRGNTHYYIGTLSVTYSKFIATMTADGAAMYFEDTAPSLTFKKYIDEKGNRVNDPTDELPHSGVGSSTSAAAGHDGRFDFEGVELGTPKVPGLATSVNTNEYGYWLDIMTDPTDAANQVISHIVIPSSNTGNSQTYTASKTIVGGANCYVFEFDVLVANGSGGQLQTAINGTVFDSSGNTKTVKLFQTNTTLSGTYNNASIKIEAKRDDVTSCGSLSNPDAPKDESKGLGNYIIKSTKISGWANIRFELYVDKGIVQIYFDGEYRGETDLVYTNQMGATLTTASLYTVYGSRQELYFDNVIVEAIKKEYVPQTCANPTAAFGDGSEPLIKDDEGAGDSGNTTPDTPVDPDTPIEPDPIGPSYPEGFDGTYDFSEFQAGTEISKIYGVSGKFPIGGYSIVSDDPTGATNRVLQFMTVGRNASGSNEWIDFAAYQLYKAEKYVFEWDMYFETVGSSSTDIIQIKFGNAYMLLVAYNPSNNTYSLTDASSTSSGDDWYVRQSTMISGITAKDWHSFKAEYAVVGTKAMIKIYVDNILRAVSDNHFGATAKETTNTDAFGFLRFYSTWLGDFTMDIDNVKVYASTEKIEKAEYTHFVHRPDYYEEPTIIEGAVSDFDNVDNIAYDTNAPMATYTVVDDPLATATDEAVNKVMKVTLQNTAQTYDGNNVLLYNSSEAKSTGVYEFAFDVYFGENSLTANAVPLQFVFNTGDNRYAMLFSIKYNENGGFTISQDLHSSKAGVSKTLADGPKLADGKWHNLRIVIEYNGENTYVNLYVDGVLVIREITYFWTTAVTDGTALKSVTWRVKNNIVGDVYFDNMYFTYIGELKD